VINRAATRLTILAPLRHRTYRLLFLGQVISNVGDHLTILALITLVLYRWELGAAAWGGILTALTIPAALLGPFAGVWVDRWDRRRVMIVCDLARAGIVLGLVWAPNLAVVLLLVAGISTCSTFFGPAQQATIRSTVPDDDLLAANALSELSDNGARLIGPALGGVLVIVAGAQGAFVVDSVTFLASAIVLSRLRIDRQAADVLDAGTRRFTHDLRAGLVHIARHRVLLIAVGATVVAAILIRATDTLGALVLKELGISEGLQGFSATALGAGYVAGALVAGQWGQRFSALRIMGAGRLVIGVIFVLLGVAVIANLSGVGIIVFAAFIGRALLGFGFAISAVAYGFILQHATPPEMMGRVIATTRSLIAGLPLAAPLLATQLVDSWSLGAAYATFGVALMVAGGVLMLTRRHVSGLETLPQ
jgi:MFS family permease